MLAPIANGNARKERPNRPRQQITVHLLIIRAKTPTDKLAVCLHTTHRCCPNPPLPTRLVVPRLHSSSFFPPSFLAPPPKSPPRTEPRPAALADLAAGGYSLPSTVTRGSQVHHSDSDTPLRAWGMCWPQPRQDFLAVGWGGEGGREREGCQQVWVSRGLSQAKDLQQVGQSAPKHIVIVRDGFVGFEG